MTKKEFLKQGVEALRAALLGMFDDPEGELAGMTKQPLIKFARENWKSIEPNLPQSDEVSDSPERFETDEEAIAAGADPEEVEEAPLDLEPELPTGESVATPDESEEEVESWSGDPSTNLHTGLPGNQYQRVGTRDLA